MNNLQLALVHAYFWRQIKEFIECKSRILELVNVDAATFIMIDSFLYQLLERMQIYYREYLSGNLTQEQLRKFLKKEIRLLLFKSKIAATLQDSSENAPKRLQNQINFVLEYAESIFLEPKNPNELMNILNSALALAQKLWLNQLSSIFIEDYAYSQFLKEFYGPYPDKDLIRKKYENLLKIFSSNKIAVRIDMPETPPPNENLLLQTLESARQTVINSKIKEIFPVYRH